MPNGGDVVGGLSSQMTVRTRSPRARSRRDLMPKRTTTGPGNNFDPLGEYCHSMDTVDTDPSGATNQFNSGDNDNDDDNDKVSTSFEIVS